MKMDLNVSTNNGRVVLETSEAYYYVMPDDAVSLAFQIMQAALNVDNSLDLGLILGELQCK